MTIQHLLLIVVYEAFKFLTGSMAYYCEKMVRDLLTDAKESVGSFYEQFGFQPFYEGTERLLAPS